MTPGFFGFKGAELSQVEVVRLADVIYARWGNGQMRIVFRSGREVSSPCSETGWKEFQEALTP
jgi:hypothetical protein